MLKWLVENAVFTIANKGKYRTIMEQYKKDFIDFMVSCGVLTFGDFVTKSGRKTPYFINTGNYKTGSQLNRLGHYYARCIYDTLGDNFDLLFGPAYKGSACGSSIFRSMRIITLT